MNLSSYIARRYFFSKSSRNAVNIISAVSITGILVGTLALVIVLSAFNGLESLVHGFFNTFDPELKVSPKEGKYFELSSNQSEVLKSTEGIASYSQVLEERVLLTYRDMEHIATIKGVDEAYTQVTEIESAITHGAYMVHPSGTIPKAVMGAGVTYYLGYGRISFEDPINVFVPKRGASASDFSNAFSSELIYPQGIFSVQPEVDEKYLLAPLGFVRNLLGRPAALTSIEIKVRQDADIEEVKRHLIDKLGSEFLVQNREEQQAIFLKVMKNESLFTFLVFALILGIATFTIMGSLSMLMLDKKKHIYTLWAVGADLKTLRLIFFKVGMRISLVGAGLGLVLGIIVVLGQQYFGWLSIGQNYIVESYPVELQWDDVVLVTLTVGCLCAVTSWLTSRRLNYSLFT